MSRKQSRILIVVLTVGSVAGLPSCGLPQRLDGVSVQPGAFIFGSPNPMSQAQLKAYGSYLHPVATKDVTSQAVWSTDLQGIVSVSPAGLVSPTGQGCGIVSVIASVTGSPNTPSGQVYTGHATITVQDASVPACPHP